jgi:hypothetical protein
MIENKSERLKALWADQAWREKTIAAQSTSKRGIKRTRRRTATHGDPAFFKECACPVCVAARLQYSRDQYTKHADKMRARARQRRLANPEVARERNRLWREKQRVANETKMAA